MNANHNNFDKKYFSLTANDFISLIKIHVPIEKNGAFFSGYCPFCKQKDEASFFVYQHNKSWHCYACRQTGNSYDFIEKTEHLSSQSAIDFIDIFINLDPKTKEAYIKKDQSVEPHIVQSLNAIKAPIIEQKVVKVSELDISDIIKPQITKVTHLKKVKKETPISHTEQTGQTEQIDLTANIFNNNFIIELLANFNKHQEIAIIDSRNDKVMGSSINHLSLQDIQELNLFIKNTLKQSKNFFGVYPDDHSQLIFHINVMIEDENKKVTWLPINSKHQYSIIIISPFSSIEKVFIMQLQNYFKSLEP